MRKCENLEREKQTRDKIRQQGNEGGKKEKRTKKRYQGEEGKKETADCINGGRMKLRLEEG